jgi:hypothetical protein
LPSKNINTRSILKMIMAALEAPIFVAFGDGLGSFDRHSWRRIEEARATPLSFHR